MLLGCMACSPVLCAFALLSGCAACDVEETLLAELLRFVAYRHGIFYLRLGCVACDDEDLNGMLSCTAGLRFC